MRNSLKLFILSIGDEEIFVKPQNTPKPIVLLHHHDVNRHVKMFVQEYKRWISQVIHFRTLVVAQVEAGLF